MNRGIAFESLGKLEAALESYQTAMDLGFLPAKERVEQLKVKLLDDK